MGRLFERGIVVRNQSVLMRGVNDTPETMTLLVKRLGHVNVHPYYVYVHDMVKGVEDLRTSVDTAHPHREERARQHGRLQHADVRRRRARRRRQARRALVRVLRPRHGHERLRGAQREAGAALPLLRSAAPALDPPAAALGRSERAKEMVDDALSKARGRGDERAAREPVR